MIIINIQNIPNQKKGLIISSSEDARCVPCTELAFLLSKCISKMVHIHRPVNRSWAKLFIMSHVFKTYTYNKYSEWTVSITKGIKNKVIMEKMKQAIISHAAFSPRHLKNLLKCK